MNTPEQESYEDKLMLKSLNKKTHILIPINYIEDKIKKYNQYVLEGVRERNEHGKHKFLKFS
jgi:hypothetical protein